MKFLLSGFVFFLFLTSIFAQVEYKPNFWGDRFYQDGVRIKNKDARTLFQGNATAMEHFDKAKKNNLYSTISTVVALGFEVNYLLGSREGGTDGLLFFAAGFAATTGATLYFRSRKKRYLSEAVNVVNQKVGYLETQWGITKHGVGLSLTF